ncbi:tetratricopeptide repeat protein [Deinococcus aquatilis]|uniref:tetratricopeptide repeat protein n=1 Tax=Deinococcus aquatilis TaxID=519440 RepID=UPI000382B216|nr:hypothetical protein [Deinococcus aquatilis]
MGLQAKLGVPGLPARALTQALIWSLLTSPAHASSTVRGLMDLQKPLSTEQLPCPVFPKRPATGNVPSTSNPQLQQQLALLEKQLAQLPPQSEGYKQMKAALDAIKQGVKQEQAAQPTFKLLKYQKMSVVQALANLYVSLADHLSPEAWKAWVNNAELADRTKADKTAVVAVSKGQPLLAVAAYLKVLEQIPKDANALFNLGSLAASLGAPNEALALLDASQLQGGPRNTFYSPTAQLLTAKGYALMLVDRNKEAEQVLTQAVKLAPKLVEAQRNLAAALGNQGKCGAAKTAVARSKSRHTVPQKSAPPTTSPPPSPATLPIPLPSGPQGSDTEYNLRDVLDFSRGKVGKWPYWATIFNPYDEAQLDRRQAEYATMQASLDIKNEAQQLPKVRQGVSDLLLSVRNDALSGPRIRLLNTGQYQLFREARFKALYAQLGKDLATYQKNEQDAMRHLKDVEFANAQVQYDQAYRACDADSDGRYCRDKAEYDKNLRKCSSLVTWNNTWRGGSSFLAQSVRPLVEETDRFYTTVISYASEPRLLAELRLNHRIIRKAFIGTVPGYFVNHLSDLDRLNEPCLYIARTAPPKPVPDDQMGSFTELTANGCAPVATATVKVMLVQFGMNCEKVSVEVAKEIPWLDIGAFISVERKASAGSQTPPTARDRFIKALGAGNVRPEKLPDFDKPKGQISIFTVTAGVSTSTSVAGNGVGAKDGVYLTVDSTGKIVDYGVKGETSTTVGAEMDLGIGEVGVGLEFEGIGGAISLLPSAPGT